MLRLPTFTLHRPKTAQEAAQVVADHGREAMFVAGGTDLYPNMKRRHQTPTQVVSLARVDGLRGVRDEGAGALTIGAMTPLSAIEHDPRIRAAQPALADAVATISTPLLRNMGTLGGNLLLDTRCTYYDQTFEWRESIDFCMKKDGAICWVAPGSPRCWAVQSSDSVPLLCAMDAQVTLVGANGERRIPVRDLYRDDGIAYLTKHRDEVLTAVHLPAPGRWRAAYRKLRRRGTFDFPVLGVGACVWFDGDGPDARVTRAEIRIGGAGSYAMPAVDAQSLLAGKPLTDESIAAAAQAAFKPARPMDNTDFETAWRKKMAPVFVQRALAACR